MSKRKENSTDKHDPKPALANRLAYLFPLFSVHTGKCLNYRSSVTMLKYIKEKLKGALPPASRPA